MLNRKTKLPVSVVVATVASAIAGATFLEVRALDKIDHPPTPKKLSCISCHTKLSTLTKIADKAGDPNYLVRTGNLTAQQLKLLNSGKITLIELKKQLRTPEPPANLKSMPEDHGSMALVSK